MRSEAHRRFWQQSPLPRGEHKLGKWTFRVYSPTSNERIEYIHLRRKHSGVFLHVVEVQHYNTIMARLLEFQHDGYEIVYLDKGHGTISDQQMMNVMFQELRIPMYYSRQSGNFGYQELEPA